MLARALILLTLGLTAPPGRPAAAEPMATPAAPPCPKAQLIADTVVRENPGVIDVIVHASPTPGSRNIVVAAHLTGALGEVSGEDDLGVMKTGAPLIEVQKDGVRLGTLVQLRDVKGRAIGALGIMYGYRAGDDIERRLQRTFALRDGIARRIGSLDALCSISAKSPTSS